MSRPNRPAAREAPRPAGEEALPPLSPLERRIATLLAEAVVAEIRGLAGGQSVTLHLPHEADGAPSHSQAPQPHPAPVRSETRGPRGHGQEMGDGDAGDPEHPRDADPANRGEAEE